MKTIIVVTLTAAVSLIVPVSKSQAQIGWTLEQCAKAYDQAGTITTDPANGENFYVFNVTITDPSVKGDWSIRCWFNTNRLCDVTRYEKLDSDLTAEDLDAILQINSCGYTWDMNSVQKLDADSAYILTTDPKQGPYAFFGFGGRKILISAHKR